jgi:AAA domain
MARRRSFEEVRGHFQERIGNGDLIEMKTAAGRSFTTPEMVSLERDNIERMQAGQGRYAPLVAQHSYFEHLSNGQRQAVETILESRDQIMGFQGTAGAGKTTSLAALREAAEKEGYTVEGFAPTSRAAYQLEEAGIRDTDDDNCDLCRRRPIVPLRRKRLGPQRAGMNARLGRVFTAYVIKRRS